MTASCAAVSLFCIRRCYVCHATAVAVAKPLLAALCCTYLVTTARLHPSSLPQLPSEPSVSEEALAARVDMLVKAHLLQVTSHMLTLQSALASAGGEGGHGARICAVWVNVCACMCKGEGMDLRAGC